MWPGMNFKENKINDGLTLSILWIGDGVPFDMNSLLVLKLKQIKVFLKKWKIVQNVRVIFILPFSVQVRSGPHGADRALLWTGRVETVGRLGPAVARSRHHEVFGRNHLVVVASRVGQGQGGRGVAAAAAAATHGFDDFVELFCDLFLLLKHQEWRAALDPRWVDGFDGCFRRRFCLQFGNCLRKLLYLVLSLVKKLQPFQIGL